MAVRRGCFVWHDLLTRDAERGGDFYTAVAGWTTELWKEASPPYRMWVNGGKPLGGTMVMPPGAPAPPHWLAYTSSPDTDAATAQAVALGAKLWTGPMGIPTVGRFAVLADPWGAEFAIYTPANAMDGGGEPAVGEFSWHELLTDEPEKAFDFYAALFGWEKTSAMDMGPAGLYQMYGLGGQPLGGIYRRPAHVPASAWLHYIRVADLDQAMAAVKAHGGTCTEAMEVPGGDWITTGTDSTGAAFALHQKAGDRKG